MQTGTDRTASANCPAEARLRASRRVPALIFLVLAALWLALLPFPQAFSALMAQESGIIENIVVVISLVGAILALKLCMRLDSLKPRWLRWWFLCFVGGLTFIAGEEASWGQHWFGWQTPDLYAELNVQRETNLHNLHKWVERLLKNLLAIPILITGLLWPLALRVAPQVEKLLPSWLRPIWPASYLWPSAAFAFGLRLVERILVWFRLSDNEPIAKSLKESIEVFLVLFVVMYLFDIWSRSQSARAHGRPDSLRHGRIIVGTRWPELGQTRASYRNRLSGTER